ncbi:histidine phosphatase family protein [Nocardioides sp.]|uniref:histidine phosphatase family protein n=1 Tax=Nocardioides sp. TaxID=35761 RepID=UPI0039E25F56
MRRLLLVRHGQTDWNRQGRVQGHLDAPLNDTGRAQAAAVAVALAGFAPTLVWSSDLSRAAETASHIAGAAGVEVTLDQRLRERSWGEAEGLTGEEFQARHPGYSATDRPAELDVLPGMEPIAVVRARMVAALTDFLELVPAGGCGVAVSHGGACKAGVLGLMGWPDAGDAVLAGLDNCGWAELHREAGRPLRLISYNRTAPIS